MSSPAQPQRGEFCREQHLADLGRREAAWQRWHESEWVLAVLRSKSGTPLTHPDKETLVDWFSKLPDQRPV